MSSPVRRPVRVTPRAKRPGVQGLREDGVLLVRVGAPPEDGRANAELCATVASALGLRARQVDVVIGHTARDKVVEIDGLTSEEVDARLRAQLALRCKIGPRLAATTRAMARCRSRAQPGPGCPVGKGVPTEPAAAK